MGLLTAIRRRLRRTSSKCPSSSSTIRIVNAVSLALMRASLLAHEGRGDRLRRQGKEESGSLALLAFGPYFSAVALDDAVGDGQAHAFSGGQRGMEALKDLE